MGYYSCFSLKIGVYNAEENKIRYLDHDEIYQSIIANLRKDCSDAEHALDEGGYFNCETRWYSCDEDMIEFSKKYPNCIFYILREGEENLDIEDNYYYNGKHQVCPVKVSFDDFDASFFGLK